MNNTSKELLKSNQEEMEIRIAHQSFSHHAKSFRLAATFLPKENLDSIAVLYHFCRLVDDAVDEAPSAKEAHENLRSIESILDSDAPSSLNSFKRVVKQYSIPRHAIQALMDGCEGDLTTVRIPTPKELAFYCYQVAGSVGEMMSPLLNVRSTDARKYAIDLGLGMQITNICRDVSEDAQRGRIYLPDTWLKEYNLNAEDILSLNIQGKDIAPVINTMLQIADICYRRAYIGCQYIPFRSRIGILIARRVYRAIGTKLQSKHQSNPFHGRTILTKWEKLWQVGLGFLDALNPVTLGWWKTPIPSSPFYQEYEELLQYQRKQAL